jgi:integrase
MAKAKYTYNEKRKEWNTQIWDGTFTPDGKKHRKTITSKKSSKDLEDKVNSFKLSVSENGNTRFSTMTFGEYANHWLTNAKGMREKNTITMYRNIIDKHLWQISCVPISQIQHSHFLQVINSAADKPRTCEQISVTFKQIIKMAAQDRILPRGDVELITSNISLPKKIKREKRALTQAEKDAIKIADFSDKERLFVSILYSCGLRREEILALKRSDFDFKAKEISVNKVIIFDGNNPEIKLSTKSERGFRRVPYPSMEQYAGQISETDGFIFGSGEKPMTKSGYDNLWRSILIKINAAAGGKSKYDPAKKKTLITENAVPGLTAHIFRHNYCSELCYKVPQISIKKIAKLMGDTEKVVLDVYNHIIDEKEDTESVIADVFHL